MATGLFQMTALRELRAIADSIPVPKPRAPRPNTVRVENADDFRVSHVDYTPALASLGKQLEGVATAVAKIERGDVTVNIDLKPLADAIAANTEAIRSLEAAYRAPRQIVEKNGRLGLKVG